MGSVRREGLKLLTESDRDLFERARKASKNAYAPYSNFKVGAAVRTERGGIFAACNVENASYSLTVCAERNAVFAAVAAEGPGVRISELAIYGDAQTVSPCGACRQVLVEFGPNARVLFPDGENVSVRTASDLLPVPFTLEVSKRHG